METASEVARVLVVDDATPLRELIATRLRLDGRFEVVAEAGDGQQAVSLALQVRPDLVLLDLAMPVMDGLEALRHIRAQLPDAAVVVLSGFRSEQMAPEALKLGARAYIEKGTELRSVTDVLALVHTSREGEGGPRITVCAG